VLTRGPDTEADASCAGAGAGALVADAATQRETERRFGGVARLYGAAALARFGTARVGIVGLGGVGTWTAEALARSGVAHLTLVDLDHIAPSNTNRQVHAVEPDFGKAKVIAMAERIAQIHPAAQVRPIEDFITGENAAELLAGLDLVIDCIDQVPAKAALIAFCTSARIAVITCGGAGGRQDPARVRRADLARTSGDPLLAALRHRLRHEYGFAAARGSKPPPQFGVEAIFSDEVLAWPASESALAGPAGSPLACGGYGSAVTVTATMGLAAAAAGLARLQAP